MDNSTYKNIISEDTYTILLLCSMLEKQNRDTPLPLSNSEYVKIADALKNLNLRPRNLLNADIHILETLFKQPILRDDKKLTSERLTRLLDRGGLLALSLSRWTSAGMWIISRADQNYPTRYKHKLGRSAPPLVYGIGEIDLLERGGIAVVGSRKPDPESESYTYHVGKWAASASVQVVSGAAKGVDEISMLSCAEAGGTSIGIVAENLIRASTKRDFRNAIIKKHLTLISSYSPEAGFSVGNAMGRNKWIYALADQALVVASSEGRGGTWAGAIEALKKGLTVHVKTGNPARPGNDALVNHGAIPAPDDLGLIFAETKTKTIVTNSKVNRSIFEAVTPVILKKLQTPMTLESLSLSIGVLEAQTLKWLEQLIIEGKVEKKKMVYQSVIEKVTLQPSLFKTKQLSIDN